MRIHRAKFKLLVIFFIIIGCLISFKEVNANQYESWKNVLYISSYSPNYETFSDQLAGIKKGIDKEINIQMEYMDSRRFLDKENTDKFYELLKYKLENNKKYDVVILADDQALKFGLDYKDDLFKDIPIVFLGASLPNSIERAKKEGGIYGITEVHSIKDNIELINELHEGKDINIITDASSEHLYEQNDLKKLYKNNNIKNISLDNLSFDELKDKLKDLGDNDVVLVIYPYVDKYGNLKNIKGSYELIKKNTNIPIYSVMDYGVECGFVGGKVVSHYEQGKIAGSIAKDILDGKKPKEKVINGEDLNKFIFDYEQLKANQIRKKDLPKNSKVINSPIDTIYKYKEIVYTSITLIISLIIVVISLILYMIKKIHYEKELIKAKELAENINKSQSNFISNISHELRTPVAVIMSANQILDMNMKKVENNYSESNRGKIDIIKQNCNRLLRLTNNIIDIAKVDSGFMILKLRNIDIIQLIESITMSVIPYASSKNIDIVFDTSDEELIMGVDPDKIERIVLNLISNAIKFSNDNTSIYVNIYVDRIENILKFSVKDTGIGIDESHLERIFERFTQVDDIMIRRNEGSGIGLSLVKIFTSLHKGDIDVKSKVSEGSEFIIKLPIIVLEDEDEVSCQLDKEDTTDSKIALEFSDIDF
jgi:signal transduction histidine kinase/ABC-type uncharacterized transport system substrate-binding protein